MSIRNDIILMIADTLDELPDSDLIALNLILSERLGQKTREGWTAEHDENHPKGDLAAAAAVYAKISSDEVKGLEVRRPLWWPWSPSWFKPKGFQRNLERSGALIIAELSRMVRVG